MLLLVNHNLYASPLTLKCSTDTGEETVDLIIDVANHTMKWGIIEYNIVGTTDTYITAYQNSTKNVGGEVWVINRITGLYKRASVDIYFYKGQKPEEGTLKALTFEGHCGKQQF